MPNYKGIYALPSGGDIGITPIQSTGNDPSGWVLPPTAQQGDQGYYWDWSTQTYQQRPKGGIALPKGVNPITGTSGPTYGPGPGFTPRVPTGGVQVPYSTQVINPNDPNQRYRAVDIMKAPAIAGAESDLMTAFKKGASDSMKGFDDYLGTFKSALGTAMDRSRAATDPSQTIANLRSGQARYADLLGQGRTDYAGLNARTALAEQGIVQEARDLIPEYDRAAQAAADQQMRFLQANVSRYKTGSGTPTSMGSAEQQLLARGAAGILVPMAQAKINQRYSVLSNYALPVAMDIANREQARIGTFNPYTAQQEFQSGQVTEQTINQLQTIASQMSRADAVAFMQAVGVPISMQQQILSGQIAQLGALGQLEESTRYRGLQDVLGVNVTQPQYYSTFTGSYPNMGRYTPAIGPQGYPAQYSPPPITGAAAAAPVSRYAALNVPRGTAPVDYTDYPGVELAA